MNETQIYPTPVSTADELPPEGEDMLWWYPKPPHIGWRLGWYSTVENYPPGCFASGESCWFLCDGPTWWMFLPLSPEGVNNVGEM